MSLGMLYGLSSLSADFKSASDAVNERAKSRAAAETEKAKLAQQADASRRAHPTIQERVGQLKGLAPDELEMLLRLEGRKTQAEIDSGVYENYGQGESAYANAGKANQDALNAEAQRPWIAPKAEAEIAEKQSNVGENEAQRDKYRNDIAMDRKKALQADLKANTPYEAGGIGENAGAGDEYSYNLLSPEEQATLRKRPDEDPAVFANEISQVWDYADKTGNEELKAGVRHVMRQNPEIFSEPAPNPDSPWNTMRKSADPLEQMLGK